MKVKSILLAAILALAITPNIAGANVRPVVEAFSFTPNDLDLISANTNVTFVSAKLIGESVRIKFVAKVLPYGPVRVT